MIFLVTQPKRIARFSLNTFQMPQVTAAVAQASLPALLEGPQLVLSLVLRTGTRQRFSTFCILPPTRHFVKILVSHCSRNSFTNPLCVTLSGHSDFVSSRRVNVTNVARVLEVIPSSMKTKTAIAS
jgi:hypothetical protein